jgi:hypothetical protein
MGWLDRSLGKRIEKWLLIQILQRASKDTITAHAGGGKASATALAYGLNRISVCATAADSVLLPPALAGLECIVVHDGAAAAQVFGKGIDTIDAVATAVGVVLTNGNRCVYTCSSNGLWQSNMGVKSA